MKTHPQTDESINIPRQPYNVYDDSRERKRVFQESINATDQSRSRRFVFKSMCWSSRCFRSRNSTCSLASWILADRRRAASQWVNDATSQLVHARLSVTTESLPVASVYHQYWGRANQVSSSPVN